MTIVACGFQRETCMDELFVGTVRSLWRPTATFMSGELDLSVDFPFYVVIFSETSALEMTKGIDSLDTLIVITTDKGETGRIT